jgi:hypothetical protein
VDPRADLDAVDKIKNFALTRIEARSPSIIVIIIIKCIFKMIASNTALFRENTKIHTKYK